MPIYYYTHTDRLLEYDVQPGTWTRFKNPATGRKLRVVPLVVVGDGVPAPLYAEASGESLIARVSIVGTRCPVGSALSWWVCSNLHPDTMVDWSDVAGRTRFLDNLRRLRTRAQELRCSGIFLDAEDYARTTPPGGGPMDHTKAWLPAHLPPISAQDVARATAAKGLAVGYLVKPFEHHHHPQGGRTWLADWTRLYAAAAKRSGSKAFFCSEDFNISYDPFVRNFARRGGYTWMPGFYPDGLGRVPLRDSWVFDQDQIMLREAASR